MRLIPRASLLSFVLAGLVLTVTIGSPVQALPVFLESNLNPNGISPVVQNLVEVSYTVGADSAQVSILVTETDSVTVVATIQPLTTRTKDNYSLLYDGRNDAGQFLPDGEYLVKLFGFGLQDEGSETVYHQLEVDSVPPQFLDFDLVSPADGIVSNGDTVVVELEVTGHQSITADYYSIDSEFDPGLVANTPAGGARRRLTYILSGDNTRLDATGLLCRITAVDQVGNAADQLFNLCLRNNPPEIIDLKLINGDPNAFANGDIVILEVAFSSPAAAITPTADFSELDTGFDPANVAVSSLGNLRYQLTYAISAENEQADGTFAIPVVGADPGCGKITGFVDVNLDNEGVVAAVIRNVRVTPGAFHPFPPQEGPNDQVLISWETLEDSVRVLVGFILPDGLPGSVAVIRSQETQPEKGFGSFVWHGLILEEYADQVILLQVIGTSFDSDRRRLVQLPVTLDREPPHLQTFTASPEVVVPTTRVELSLDFGEIIPELTADFSQLDSNYDPSRLEGPTLSGTTYTYVYTVSLGNSKPDGIFPIVIAAADSAGNADTFENTVTLCISTRPPGLRDLDTVVSRPEISPDPYDGPFRQGDVVQVVTYWESEDSLTVEYDFSALSTEEVLVKADFFEGAYTGSFRVTSTNPSSLNLPVLVTALDQGCGVTSRVAARVDLDNVDPPKPVLDPIPGTATTDSVFVSGRAPQAFRVVVKRQEETIDTLAVVDDVFAGNVHLIAGENVLHVISEDEAGNRSNKSENFSVFFVAEDFFTIPKRFRPGDEFFVGLIQPATRVDIRIFNLEGIEIQRLEEASVASTVRIPWDGLDNRGSLAGSGPYFCVIQTHRASGPGSMIRKAFVFTRK